MAQFVFAGIGLPHPGQLNQLIWSEQAQGGALMAYADKRTGGALDKVRALRKLVLFAGQGCHSSGKQAQIEWHVMAQCEAHASLLKSFTDARTGAQLDMIKHFVFAGTRDHPPTTEQALQALQADRLLSPMSRSDERRAVKQHKHHAFAGNGGHVEACEKIAEEEEATRLLSPNSRTDEKRSVGMHKHHAFAGEQGHEEQVEQTMHEQKAARLMSPMPKDNAHSRKSLGQHKAHAFGGNTGGEKTLEVETVIQKEKAARMLSANDTKNKTRSIKTLNTMNKAHAFAGDAPYSEQPAVDEKAARLLSNTQTKVGEDLQPYKGRQSTIYIDSGAYSAWTRGVTIDLGKYCEFLKEYADVVDYSFNLDVIPGAAGREATKLERTEAIAQGFANWREMRKRGLHSLHTFHYGEDVSVLRAIRDESLGEMPEPYMAIGGAAKLEGRDRDGWLMNTVWPELVDKHGAPKLKVHGLGMTDIGTIKAYPWASVDSTSWIFLCSQGKVVFWIDGELKTYYASSRHRQGWHDYSEAEKAKLTELLGQENRDFASMKPKDQLLFLMRHNIRELKKLETMMPDILPASSRPRRRLI